jgi:hypothetical protein
MAFLIPTVTCWDSTSIRPQLLTSKSFAIHRSASTIRCYIVWIRTPQEPHRKDKITVLSKYGAMKMCGPLVLGSLDVRYIFDTWKVHT